MKFKQYLLTEELRKFSWNPNLEVGWWEDNKNLIMYHGTHIDNLESISKEGISAPREGYTANWVSLAFDPYTARGYASMMGGEARFIRSKKPKTVPMSERVVIVLKIPVSYIKSKMAPMRKAVGGRGNQLTDREGYFRWKKETGLPDFKWYELTEVRLPAPLDKKYIIGYMVK